VFDWLFEGRQVIYWLLGTVAVLLLLVWWRSRNRKVLIAAGVAFALGVLYFLLSLTVETPRTQVVRKLHEMAAAVKARDADGMFRHIANDFKFRGQDRATFHNYVDMVLRRGLISDLVIYDEDFPSGGDGRTLLVNFMAKPRSDVLGDQPAYPVEAKFVREPDGQWRMAGFEVYNPVAGRQKMDIPSLPP
jgi:hypothetical protein